MHGYIGELSGSRKEAKGARAFQLYTDGAETIQNISEWRHQLYLMSNE